MALKTLWEKGCDSLTNEEKGDMRLLEGEFKKMVSLSFIWFVALLEKIEAYNVFNRAHN